MTTTCLPGNPCAVPPNFSVRDLDNAVIVHALMALAFEQRTANLIAYVKHIDDTDPAVLGQIFPRLGLDDPR